MSNIKEIIKYLEAQSKPGAKEGMARFGIQAENALGVPVPVLRTISRKLKINHKLALELWATKIHEAMVLATMIADPAKCDNKLMDKWVEEFYSWDLCDQACMNLFCKTENIWDKTIEWCHREEEYQRRAGFAMIAVLACKDKKACDEDFLKLLPLIELYSTDKRNFVKKAVNWALRQIGKKRMSLNAPAIKLAEKLMDSGDKTAYWIGRDAFKELTGETVQHKLKQKLMNN